mmetsp:Transcript_157353/g.504792  ORF Transcript_157353/g.504792 Transcript_157353/m.504792 type:complete len:231 (-) Transcript_157353:44-736(-)
MLKAREQQAATAPEPRLVLGHVHQDVTPFQPPDVLAVGQGDGVLDAEGSMRGLKTRVAQDTVAVLAFLEDHEVEGGINAAGLDQLARAATIAVLELLPEEVPPEQVVGHHLDVEASWAGPLQAPLGGGLLALTPLPGSGSVATRPPGEGVRGLALDQFCPHRRIQLQQHMVLRVLRQAAANATCLDTRRQRRQRLRKQRASDACDGGLGHHHVCVESGVVVAGCNARAFG